MFPFIKSASLLSDALGGFRALAMFFKLYLSTGNSRVSLLKLQFAIKLQASGWCGIAFVKMDDDSKSLLLPIQNNRRPGRTSKKLV